jgi:hypothetical protein
MRTNKSNAVRINYEINNFNTENSHLLNGVLLSYSGGIRRGYQLYFKDVDSGKIECVIATGNFKDIINGIGTIYRYFLASKNFKK